jgi:hypothetical protein
MQGTRIRLEYFDQNEPFAACMPRTGTLVRRLAVGGWAGKSHVLELDEPFEYEGCWHERVLIRSRWQQYRVGGREPTSVFILLIPDAAALERPRPEDFAHVAWGIAHALGPWWRKLAVDLGVAVA